MATRTAQGAKALPGKYYTDPAIYRVETERIFYTRWLYVGRLSDLEEWPFLGGPMELAQDYQSMTMSGHRCAAPLGEVSGEDLGRVYYYTIFPNMLLSLFSDYILIHRIQPQSAGQTRIVCDWLFHPDAISQPDFDPASAIEFLNMTNKQDWQVSELSKKGIASRAYVPGPYAGLESMIAAWDREYLQALGSDQFTVNSEPSRGDRPVAPTRTRRVRLRTRG